MIRVCRKREMGLMVRVEICIFCEKKMPCGEYRAHLKECEAALKVAAGTKAQRFIRSCATNT